MRVILVTRDNLRCEIQMPDDTEFVIVRKMRGLYNPFAEVLKGKAKFEALQNKNVRRYERQGLEPDGTPVFVEV